MGKEWARKGPGGSLGKELLVFNVLVLPSEWPAGRQGCVILCAMLTVCNPLRVIDGEVCTFAANDK